jgi:hypothetical protein
MRSPEAVLAASCRLAQSRPARIGRAYLLGETLSTCATESQQHRAPRSLPQRRQPHLLLAKARHAGHDTLHITQTGNTTGETLGVTIAA